MPAPKVVDGFMDPSALFDRMRALEAIDAKVAADVPSFEFHPRWAPGEKAAAFKDGSGNELFVWSSAKGTVVRGFDLEVGVSASLVGFPKALQRAIDEPAFGGDEDLTFVRWNLASEGRWYGTSVPKRLAKELLGFLGDDPAQWLEDYYGEKLPAKLRALLPASKKKEKQKKAKAKPKRAPRRSFGQAQFVVQCEPTYVQMVIGGNDVVARANEDVYEEIFDWVKARLKRAARGG
jgi:hypothetical protein